MSDILVMKSDNLQDILSMIALAGKIGAHDFELFLEETADDSVVVKISWKESAPAKRMFTDTLMFGSLPGVLYLKKGRHQTNNSFRVVAVAEVQPQ